MTLLATPSSAQLIPSAPFLDANSSIQDVKRREMSKSSINIRKVEDKNENTTKREPDTPRSKSVATLQPSKSKMATEKKSSPNSGTATPTKVPSSPSKIGAFGASLKSKLQAISSPLKTKSAPGSPKIPKEGRKNRRMSAVTIGSSRSLQTPTIKVNDSSVDLDQAVGGYRQRLTRSARPGRLTSASSLKKRKKKKKRSKSEAVLQEKKKDKWADYAMQYANDIEMEGGIQKKDKWDSYVKNCIEASESPLMKKAEKKAGKQTLKMTYSTDEDDSSKSESESDNSDSDSNKGKKKKQKKTKKKNEKSTKGKGEEKEQKSRKLSKNEMKNMFGDDQDTSESESESGSEDEGDLHARLLASMEKDVIPEESEEDLITSRKPKDNDIAKTPAPAKAEEKPMVPTKKDNPKQKPPEKITNEVKPKVPVTEKPKPKQSEKPAPKTKVEKKDSLKTPSQETTQNKNYQNGPVVDFHEQIRKISTAHGPQAPDLSQLDIPEKHRTSSQNEDDIHNTIDDILKEEPKTGSKSRRGSAKRPISAANSATNVMAEGTENEEEKMKALEEHILENHGKHKQKDEMKKKGSEIDDLISELNLDT